MQTLQISPANAKKLYPTAAPEFKQMLEDTFTKEFFNKNFRDIKTYEDACEDQGIIDPLAILPWHSPNTPDHEAANAIQKMWTIARSLNGPDWKADWNNFSQYKYYPWFKANPSGFGLSYYGYGFRGTFTYVGSRLCYKSAEIAEYAGKQFIDLYNKFLK